MSQSIIDFSSPAAGFDQPLALWRACHGRVQRMTRLLQRLAGHLRERGADDEARAAATSILRYFDEAAPRHHDDEEQDLFPCLRARAPRLAGPDAAALLEAIDTLEKDHREIAAIWQRLRAPLTSIAQGNPAPLDAARVDEFFERYQAHMRIEDSRVEAALRELLNTDDWARIGRAMAERRGVDWNDLTGTA